MTKKLPRCGAIHPYQQDAIVAYEYRPIVCTDFEGDRHDPDRHRGSNRFLAPIYWKITYGDKFITNQEVV